MFKRINKESAIEKLANEKTILFDIRDGESYDAGHISQAIHLTQNDLDSILGVTPKDSPILIMCYHGNSSQNVAAYFGQHGFKDVYSIDGGYEGWIND